MGDVLGLGRRPHGHHRPHVLRLPGVSGPAPSQPRSSHGGGPLLVAGDHRRGSGPAGVLLGEPLPGTPPGPVHSSRRGHDALGDAGGDAGQPRRLHRRLRRPARGPHRHPPPGGGELGGVRGSRRRGRLPPPRGDR